MSWRPRRTLISEQSLEHFPDRSIRLNLRACRRRHMSKWSALHGSLLLKLSYTIMSSIRSWPKVYDLDGKYRIIGGKYDHSGKLNDHLLKIYDYLKVTGFN